MSAGFKVVSFCWNKSEKSVYHLLNFTALSFMIFLGKR